MWHTRTRLLNGTQERHLQIQPLLKIKIAEDLQKINRAKTFFSKHLQMLMHKYELEKNNTLKQLWLSSMLDFTVSNLC